MDIIYTAQGTSLSFPPQSRIKQGQRPRSHSTVILYLLQRAVHVTYAAHVFQSDETCLALVALVLHRGRLTSTLLATALLLQLIRSVQAYYRLRLSIPIAHARRSSRSGP